MPQSIDIPGVGMADFPDDAKPEEIQQFLDENYNRAPQTSAAGAFGRSGVTGVLPGGAFMAAFPAGAKGGAALGALIPGLGETGIGEAGGALIGGTITGGLAAYAASKLQQKALEANFPEKAKELEQLQRADVQQHPIASGLGEIASLSPTAKLAPFKMAQIPLRVALGAGMTTAQSLATRQELPGARELAVGTIMGGIYGEGRGGKGKPARDVVPSTPEQQSAREKSVLDAATAKGYKPHYVDSTISGKDGDLRVAEAKEDGTVTISRQNLHRAMDSYVDPKITADDFVDRLMTEEGLHLASMEDPKWRERQAGFWNDFTKAEKWAFRKIIPNPNPDEAPMADWQYGSEASRFLLQRAMGMEPTEFVEFGQRFQLRTLEGMIDLVRWMRGGSKASARQREVLDYALGNFEAAKKGAVDASSKPGAESATQREVRPPVGEETPLRQQGEAAPAQAPEAAPVAKAAQVSLAVGETDLTKSEAPRSAEVAAKVGGATEIDEPAKPAADKIEKVSPVIASQGTPAAAPARGKVEGAGVPKATTPGPTSLNISATPSPVKAEGPGMERQRELMKLITEATAKGERPDPKLVIEYSRMVNRPKEPPGTVAAGSAMTMRQRPRNYEEIHAVVSGAFPERNLDRESLRTRDEILNKAASFISNLKTLAEQEEGIEAFRAKTEHYRQMDAQRMEGMSLPGLEELKSAIHFHLNKTWGPVKVETKEGTKGQVKMRYESPEHDKWRRDLLAGFEPVRMEFINTARKLDGKPPLAGMPEEYKNEDFTRQVWNEVIDEFLTNVSKDKLYELRSALGLDRGQFRGVLLDPDVHPILTSLRESFDKEGKLRLGKSAAFDSFANARGLSRDEAKTLLEHLEEKWGRDVAGNALPGPLAKKYLESLAGGTKLTELESAEVERRMKDYEMGARRLRAKTNKFIGEVSRRLVATPKDPMSDPLRNTFAVDDIEWESHDAAYPYRQFVEGELLNREWLEQQLTDESGPPSAPRRITVLRNRETGAIDAVTTYSDHKKTYLYDPKGEPGDKAGKHVRLTAPDGEYKGALATHEILATALLRHPARHFHQRWANQAEYMAEIGDLAKRNSESIVDADWDMFTKSVKKTKAEIEAEKILTPEEEAAGERAEDITEEKGREEESATEGLGRISETSNPEELRARKGTTWSEEEQMSQKMSNFVRGPGEGTLGLLRTKLHSFNRGPLTGTEARSMFGFFERHKGVVKDIVDINKVLRAIQKLAHWVNPQTGTPYGMRGRNYAFISGMTKVARKYMNILLDAHREGFMATKGNPDARRLFLQERAEDAWGLAQYEVYEDVKKAREEGRSVEASKDGESGPSQIFKRIATQKYGDNSTATLRNAALRLGATVQPEPLEVGTERDRAIYRSGGRVRELEGSSNIKRPELRGGVGTRGVETAMAERGQPGEEQFVMPDRAWSGGATRGAAPAEPPEMLPPVPEVGQPGEGQFTMPGRARPYVAHTEPDAPPVEPGPGTIPPDIGEPKAEGYQKKTSAMPPEGYVERTGGERTERYKEVVRNNMLYEEGYMRKRIPPGFHSKVGPQEFGRLAAKAAGLSEEGPAMTMRQHGIARKYREQMEAQGRVVLRRDGEDVVTDQDAMSIQDQVNEGKRLVRSEGWDPVAVRNAIGSGYIRYADGWKYLSVLRFHNLNIVDAADQIRTQAGENYKNSKDWIEANRVYQDWANFTAEVQKAWSKAGHIQQGVEHIPTGNWTQTRDMARKAKGKDLTAKEDAEGEDYSDAIAEGDQALTMKVGAQQKALAKADPEGKLNPSQEAMVKEIMDKQKAELERVKGEIDKLFPGGSKMAMRGSAPEGGAEPLHPAMFEMLTMDGAVKISELAREGEYSDSNWKLAMLKEHGADISPHLDMLLEAATARQAKNINATLGTEKATAPVRRKLTRKMPSIEKSLEVIQRAMFMDRRGKRISTPEAFHLWNFIKQKYLTTKGDDETWPTYDEILKRASTDIGSSSEEMKGALKGEGFPIERIHRALSTNKTVRLTTKEMWEQADRNRRVLVQARNWMKNLQYPKLVQWARRLPRYFFMDKVFGHGFVGQVTHAAPMAFNPYALKTYFNGWADMYKMGISSKYHHLKMLEIQNHPRYAWWRSQGLQINPFSRTDDYSVMEMNKTIMALTRGYGFDALKTMRLEQADKMYKALPAHLRTDAMGKLIAQSVNYMTGTVAGRGGPEWTNWVFFAPKLEMSRWGFLFKDPMRAIDILGRAAVGDKRVDPVQIQWAKSELMQKAAIVGIYYGFLALNQAILKWSGSDQDVNSPFMGRGGDPRRSDFLQFKISGMKVGFAGPLIGMARMLADALHIGYGKQTRMESLSPRQKTLGGRLAEYAVGKMSPIGHFGLTLASQQDFMGRPMPWSSDTLSRSQKMRGMRPYGWGEYLSEELSPIPLEEAFKEIWKDQGMSEIQASTLIRALTVAGTSLATGVRVSDDQFVGR